MRFALVLLLSLSCSPAALAGYVGNTFGSEGKYKIFQFSKSGNPLRPISDDSFEGVAWPSAIKIDSATHVYASVRVDGKWQEIHRWTSVSGAPYVHHGAVLSANAAEQFGIGPATVTYDGAKVRIFYVKRAHAGPGATVDVAESTDSGATFVRKGTVYSASSTHAPGGVSVSYACTDGANHYLFLHGYASDIGTASSFVAAATAIDGRYSDVAQTVPNNGATGTFTGIAGNSFGVYSGSVLPKQALVFNDGIKAEAYVAEEVIGTVVYLDRPLEKNYTNVPVASFISKKADLSFVRRLSSGKWVGAITGYGQFPGVTSEFTGHVSAPSLSGPWKVDGGYFLNPYFNSGELSTENPEPIRTSASCSE